MHPHRLYTPADTLVAPALFHSKDKHLLVVLTDPTQSKLPATPTELAGCLVLPLLSDLWCTCGHSSSHWQQRPLCSSVVVQGQGAGLPLCSDLNGALLRLGEGEAVTDAAVARHIAHLWQWKGAARSAGASWPAMQLSGWDKSADASMPRLQAALAPALVAASPVKCTPGVPRRVRSQLHLSMHQQCHSHMACCDPCTAQHSTPEHTQHTRHHSTHSTQACIPQPPTCSLRLPSFLSDEPPVSSFLAMPMTATALVLSITTRLSTEPALMSGKSNLSSKRGELSLNTVREDCGGKGRGVCRGCGEEGRAGGEGCAASSDGRRQLGQQRELCAVPVLCHAK